METIKGAGTAIKDAGTAIVGKAAGLVTGLGKGLMKLGGLVNPSKYKATAEAFCAQAGLVAAQNGNLKPEEVQSFKEFLVANGSNPVLNALPADEMAKKFRDYAIKAFVCDEAAFATALDPIAPESDEAKLIVTGCLAIAFADGECDDDERARIEEMAATLKIDTAKLAEELGLELPSV